MKAAVAPHHGLPEVVTFKDVSTPEPKATEIRIRVFWHRDARVCRVPLILPWFRGNLETREYAQGVIHGESKTKEV